MARKAVWFLMFAVGALLLAPAGVCASGRGG